VKVAAKQEKKRLQAGAVTRRLQQQDYGRTLQAMIELAQGKRFK